MPSNRDNSRLSVKLAAILVTTLLLLLLLEITARVVFAVKDRAAFLPGLSDILQKSLILDDFEIPSPLGGYHWSLRPGWKANRNLGDLSQGRPVDELVSQAYMVPSAAKALAQRPSFQINEQGFKGDEIDKTHSRIRILNLGDSCAFGNGPFDYSIALERTLNVESQRVEVINGGVQGYAPKNILYELDRLIRLEPEIVTLYIGWNPLYSRVPWPNALENRLRIVWMFRQVYRTISVWFTSAREHALGLYHRNIRYQSDQQDVLDLEAYSPPSLDDVETIVRAFQSAGSKVVIFTLPGLFRMDSIPSPKALKIGHLPEFTDNAAVLAKLTERYNIDLRKMAARLRVQVIDMEKWASINFQPPEDYFTDSVHLNALGLGMLGKWIGKELESMVRSVEKQKIKKLSAK